MLRKLVVLFLVGALLLLGVLPGLAEDQYTTLKDYEKATGKAITSFHEAPMLRVKVAAGELPGDHASGGDWSIWWNLAQGLDGACRRCRSEQDHYRTSYSFQQGYEEDIAQYSQELGDLGGRKGLYLSLKEGNEVVGWGAFHRR